MAAEPDISAPRSLVLGRRNAARKQQRLHGAFSGGWSAGYFNSVGSKEGWQPQQWRSEGAASDGGRQQRREQRAEDFMDEEDIGDMMQHSMYARKEFDDPAAAGAGDPGAAAAPGDAFALLITPAGGDYVGARLLRRMGWRVGQGIGPRKRREARERRQRRREQRAAVASAASAAPDAAEGAPAAVCPGDIWESSESDAELICPDDAELPDVAAKLDTRGLGFDAAPASGGGGGGGAKGAKGKGRQKGSKPQQGLLPRGAVPLGGGLAAGAAALGLCVADEAGEGSDDDPYTHHDSAAYEAQLGGRGRGGREGREREREGREAALAVHNPAAAAEAEREFGGWDIKFIRGSRGAYRAGVYPPPEVPPSWDGVHRVPKGTPVLADPRHLPLMTPRQRAALLGTHRRGRQPAQSAAPVATPPSAAAAAAAAAGPGVQLFAPLRGGLAARFTSGRRQELAQGSAGAPPPPAPPADSPPRDPAAAAGDAMLSAARSGNFGSQTRTVCEWHPAKLLCRLAGVADPYPGVEAKGGTGPAAPHFAPSSPPPAAAPEVPAPRQPEAPLRQPAAPAPAPSAAEIAPEPPQPQPQQPPPENKDAGEEEEEEEERADVDLFQAIFGDEEPPEEEPQPRLSDKEAAPPAAAAAAAPPAAPAGGVQPADGERPLFMRFAAARSGGPAAESVGELQRGNDRLRERISRLRAVCGDSASEGGGDSSGESAERPGEKRKLSKKERKKEKKRAKRQRKKEKKADKKARKKERKRLRKERRRAAATSSSSSSSSSSS